MTTLIKIVLTLFIFSSTLLAIEWAKDLDTAFATAKKEKKNVMVMIEGKHCGWCTKMKNRTLSDASIEKRLEQYVVVKVMREDADSMAKLPSVNGVPTIFFMKEDKVLLQDIVGYFNVQDFTSYINDVERKSK